MTRPGRTRAGPGGQQQATLGDPANTGGGGTGTARGGPRAGPDLGPPGPESPPPRPPGRGVSGPGSGPVLAESSFRGKAAAQSSPAGSESWLCCAPARPHGGGRCVSAAGGAGAPAARRRRRCGTRTSPRRAAGPAPTPASGEPAATGADRLGGGTGVEERRPESNRESSPCLHGLPVSEGRARPALLSSCHSAITGHPGGPTGIRRAGQ